MLYWWPDWLICLEHEAIDVDDKVVGHSEFPTFFLACWLVDWLHVTLNRKLGFFLYVLIIGPLTSSFLSLHQISCTRVTIRAPLGRGEAASRSVAMKNPWVLSYHWAHSEDSDQTGRMPRLIWVFAGRTLILLVLSCRGSFLYVIQTNSVDHEQTLCYQSWKNLKNVTRPTSPNVSNAMVNLIVNTGKILNFYSFCSVRHF